jgi:SAM-dependent methyltransferase
MQGKRSPLKPRWRIIAANFVQDMRARVRLALGRLDSEIGATHRGKSTAQSVEYINLVYRSYFDYGAVNIEAVRGSRILEIGPGDNLGVALRLYAAGAANVTCADKLVSARDAEQQARIYRALRDSLTVEELERYDGAIPNCEPGRIDATKVTFRAGISAERLHGAFAPSSFDLIVSRAVLWEVHEIDDALASMDKVLKPGGKMIHKIACKDWMFRQDGYHPLEFLTLPAWLYSLIAKNSGKSNRKPMRYYKDRLQALGYEVDIQVTQTVAREMPEFPPGVRRLTRGVHFDDGQLSLVRTIRPRLHSEFGSLSDEELLIEDVFVIATKCAP